MAGWQTRRAPPITAYRQRELSAEQASGEGSNKEGAEKEAEEAAANVLKLETRKGIT